MTKETFTDWVPVFFPKRKLGGGTLGSRAPTNKSKTNNILAAITNDCKEGEEEKIE